MPALVFDSFLAIGHRKSGRGTMLRTRFGNKCSRSNDVVFQVEIKVKTSVQQMSVVWKVPAVVFSRFLAFGYRKSGRGTRLRTSFENRCSQSNDVVFLFEIKVKTFV